MKERKSLYLVFAICTLISLPSCGDGGTLSLGLTDASTADYKAVYVTISQVKVQMPEGYWKVVGTPNKTYNLLDLVNGVREEIGITGLDAGEYTEMLLLIGDTSDGGINILSKQHPYANYVIDLNDADHELKIPSGFQTGVEIFQAFTIGEYQITNLTLDFNASESVVVGGNSGTWLLKPRIKVLNNRDCSIVSGTVDDGAGSLLPGVQVSAQRSETSASDPTDQELTEASTVTDENGQFKLFINRRTYTLVVYGASYNPGVGCSLSLTKGQVTEAQDFVLNAASTGSVSGDVSIADAEVDQHATISFRQAVDCDGDGAGETAIEVRFVNVINGGSYSVALPVGSYELVASSYAKTARSFVVNVVANADTSAPVDLL